MKHVPFSVTKRKAEALIGSLRLRDHLRAYPVDDDVALDLGVGDEDSAAGGVDELQDGGYRRHVHKGRAGEQTGQGRCGALGDRRAAKLQVKDNLGGRAGAVRGQRPGDEIRARLVDGELAGHRVVDDAAAGVVLNHRVEENSGAVRDRTSGRFGQLGLEAQDDALRTSRAGRAGGTSRAGRACRAGWACGAGGARFKRSTSTSPPAPYHPFFTLKPSI